MQAERYQQFDIRLHFAFFVVAAITPHPLRSCATFVYCGARMRKGACLSFQPLVQCNTPQLTLTSYQAKLPSEHGKPQRRRLFSATLLRRAQSRTLLRAWICPARNPVQTALREVQHWRSLKIGRRCKACQVSRRKQPQFVSSTANDSLYSTLRVNVLAPLFRAARILDLNATPN